MPSLLTAGRRRTLAVSGVCASAVAAAAFVSTSAGAAPAPVAHGAQAAAAKAALPAVTLVASASVVRASHPADEDVAYLDFGFALVTGKKPIEVWVKRPVYSKPATATLVVGGVKRALPKGMANLRGLVDFATVTVTDSRGAVVPQGDPRGPSELCLGGYGAARYRPDAPDTSPYPSACGDHPFAQGTVLGLQAGWVTPLSAYGILPAGTYTAKIQMGERWRKLLAVPASAARATTKIVVTKDPSTPGPSPSPSATAVPVPAPPVPAPPVPAHAGHAPAGGRHDAAEAARDRRIAEVKKAALASGRALPARTTRPSGRATPAKAAAPRPDLRSLPSTGISLVKGKDLDEQIDPKLANHHFLTFGATVWNAGPSPLVVEGFRRPGAQLMDAYQYFYAGSRQVGYTKVGSMEYDPKTGHEHWHFKDFAQYNLLDAKQRFKVRSQKEAFCLAPTDAVDLTLRGALWKPGSTGLYTACGGREALGLRQTLEAGWGDTYGQYLPGQSFDVESLPNGTYYIEVVANPDRRLQETNLRNNRSIRKIVLGGTKARRTVTVPPYQGIKAR